jgi:hypothetical protein
MIIKEEGNGWILRLGGERGATGFHKTREGCVKDCCRFGYEFFVEESD